MLTSDHRGRFDLTSACTIPRQPEYIHDYPYLHPKRIIKSITSSAAGTREEQVAKLPRTATHGEAQSGQGTRVSEK